MNRKILVVVLLFALLTLAPFAYAKPGAEKNNEKFEYFKLVCSGAGSETYERDWASPPDGMPPNLIHARGGGWVTGSTVELTVGQEKFDTDSDPYSVDYTTTFDIEVFLSDVGEAEGYNIRLTDVVTVYEEDAAIGTLVLKLVAVVDFTVMPPTMEGTVVGYGTGDLRGVHISAVDLGMTNPVNSEYTREGTITGWPEEITNT